MRMRKFRTDATYHIWGCMGNHIARNCQRTRHVLVDIIPIERDDVVECEHQKQDGAIVSTKMINGERSNELRRGKHASVEPLQDTTAGLVWMRKHFNLGLGHKVVLYVVGLVLALRPTRGNAKGKLHLILNVSLSSTPSGSKRQATLC